MPHYSSPCHTTSNNATLQLTMPHHIKPCHATSNHATPRHTAPCRLHHATPHSTTSHHTALCRAVGNRGRTAWCGGWTNRMVRGMLHADRKSHIVAKPDRDNHTRTRAGTHARPPAHPHRAHERAHSCTHPCTHACTRLGAPAYAYAGRLRRRHTWPSVPRACMSRVRVGGTAECMPRAFRTPANRKIRWKLRWQVRKKVRWKVRW